MLILHILLNKTAKLKRIHVKAWKCSEQWIKGHLKPANIEIIFQTDEHRDIHLQDNNFKSC